VRAQAADDEQSSDDITQRRWSSSQSAPSTEYSGARHGDADHAGDAYDASDAHSAGAAYGAYTARIYRHTSGDPATYAF